MPTMPDPLPVIAPRPPMFERRATPRAKVKLWVDAGWAGGFLTEDIGPFGVAVKDGPAWRKGLKLPLAVHVPGEKELLQVTGEVIGPFGTATGMRIAFRSPPVKVAGALRRLVQQHCSPHPAA
jgi:hypothetical protein